MKMTNFFITGASGFVGNHLIERLHGAGNKIWCLTRRYKKHFFNDDSIEWIEADLLDTKSYKNILKNADYIFHLAGLLNSRRKEEYIRTNVKGTESLLDTCKEIGAPKSRFIYMSSIAAMGANYEGNLLKESDPCFPQTEYGKSKHQAELIALNYSNSIPVVILRPSFIYGRGDMRGLKYLQSLDNHSNSFWISMIKTISLCHISDLIQSCVLSIERNIKSGEIFIISDPEVYTWNKIKEILIKIFKNFPRTSISKNQIPPENFLEKMEPLDDSSKTLPNYQYWGCDISKAKRLLDFHPKISLEEGAYDTILWYLNKGLLNSRI